MAAGRSVGLYTSESNVLALLKKHYGICAAKISKASSYVNVNYVITVAEDANRQKDIKESRYVVRISDTSHESFCGSVNLQHLMLKHLGVHGITSSQPISTTLGETSLNCEAGETTYVLQVLKFVDGISVNESKMTSDDYSKISFETGKFLANLHKTLKTLDYDAEAAARISSPFHTENALFYKKRIDSVEDTRIRGIIEKHMALFEANFIPQTPRLRKTFLHGDFSDSNLIVTKSSGKWTISGVIDFEECYFGTLVGEVGIGMAYCMMKSASIADSNPVEVSGNVLRGYQEIIPLEENEKKVLFEAIVSRLCVSYISAWYEYSLCPQKKESLFAQAKNIPSVLEIIELSGRKSLEKEWFGI